MLWLILRFKDKCNAHCNLGDIGGGQARGGNGRRGGGPGLCFLASTRLSFPMDSAQYINSDIIAYGPIEPLSYQYFPAAAGRIYKITHTPQATKTDHSELPTTSRMHGQRDILLSTDHFKSEMLVWSLGALRRCPRLLTAARIWPRRDHSP